MARYEITAPDGGRYEITAPDNATEAEVLAFAQRQFGGSQQAAPEPPQPSLIERAKNFVTGADRQTRATQELPEIQNSGILDGLGLSRLEGLQFAALLLSTPNVDEAAKLATALSPDLAVAEDEKGNRILANNKTGAQTLLNAPGLSGMDWLQMGGLASLFGPSGGARTLAGLALRAGATQTAIETAQAAKGGEFNPGDIALAAGAAAAAPVVVAGVKEGGKAVATAVRSVLPGARGRAAQAGVATAEAPATAAGAQTTFRAPGVVEPQPGAPVPQQAAPAQAAAATAPPPPIAQAIPANPQAAAVPAQDVAQSARTAALGGFGSEKATQKLAFASAPDAETVAAAERLGVIDFLQPDHVSTNVAYRQLAQLVKSQVGSEARSAEVTGLAKLAERADKIIEEIGGTANVSSIDAGVKQRMQQIVGLLEDRSDALYKQVEKAVPPTTRVAPTNTLQLLTEEAAKYGGVKEFAQVAPREARLLKVLQERGEVTYAFLDGLRKQVGQGLKPMPTGSFRDSESGLLRQVYGKLADDQFLVAQSAGMGDKYSAAVSAVKTRIGLEDDLTALFGKQLESSLVGKLDKSIAAAGTGDAAQITAFIKHVPEDMRREVVASGLSRFFATTTRSGEMNFAKYAEWFEKLEKNKQAKAAVFSHLTERQVNQLTDLARVSRGIAMARGEYISTGKALDTKALEVAENLSGRIFDEVRRRGPLGVATEAVATVGGLPPGFASLMQTAMNKNAPKVADSAAKLIASPDFMQLVKAQARSGPQSAETQAAVRRFAFSRDFTNYLRALGKPREITSREQFVLQMLQANKETATQK